LKYSIFVKLVVAIIIFITFNRFWPGDCAASYRIVSCRRPFIDADISWLTISDHLPAQSWRHP